jgi:hypothetical protein
MYCLLFISLCTVLFPEVYIELKKGEQERERERELKTCTSQSVTEHFGDRQWDCWWPQLH